MAVLTVCGVCARSDFTQIFGKPLSSRDRGNRCERDDVGPLFHTRSSCPHPPAQCPPHHRSLLHPSVCQCDTFLRLVARVVTLMGCASSKEDVPSPPRSDGSGGGGGGGNADTIRTSFMSTDTTGSPEILKEVAPYTPLRTPPSRPLRTHTLPTTTLQPLHLPPHAPA